MSDQDRGPAEEDPAALREELARVQEAARQSLSHLRGELDYLRETQEGDRDVDSVTKQVALEQEIFTLRRSLREKERLVDATAAQCRRLEDELEDQHLAYDGLKQDLERKKASLAAAREQAETAIRDRHEIDERYRMVLASAKLGEPFEDGSGRLRFGIPVFTGRFVGGLLAGVLVAVIGIALWIWLDPLTALDRRSPGFAEAGSPATASPQGAPGVASSTKEPDARSGVMAEDAVPAVLGTARDRLSDGSTGPLMLALRGGDFTMGKALITRNDDEGPSRIVSLAPYLIGATEVTFEQYDRFVRATGRRFPNDFGWGRGDRPVVDVSWQDARAYARWLSQRTAKVYRLPSEAEWEYAAAAGQPSFFWWGHLPGQGRAVCFDCGTIWDNLSSAPVGTFAPNPLGLYDTAGNVMEWMVDCYHPSYVGAPSNGLPWDEAGCPFRVARGGSFNKPARSMRSRTRHRFVPETRINALGFRLARDE